MPDRLADGIARRLARLRVVPADELAREEAASEKRRRRAAFMEWCRENRYDPAVVAPRLRDRAGPFAVVTPEAEDWPRACAWQWRHRAMVIRATEAVTALKYPHDEARRALAHAVAHSAAVIIAPTLDDTLSAAITERVLTRVATMLVTNDTIAVAGRWPAFGT